VGSFASNARHFAGKFADLPAEAKTTAHAHSVRVDAGQVQPQGLGLPFAH